MLSIILFESCLLAGLIFSMIRCMKRQKARQKEGEKCRHIIEMATEGIAIAQDGKITYYNPKILEMTSFSEEEIRSLSFTAFIHPDDRELVKERYVNRLQGGDAPESYQFRILDKKGASKWFEIHSTLIEWDEKPAILFFLNDIDRRKRIEDALQEREERYSTLVELANDGIVIVQNDVLVYLNSQMAKMLGYSADEILHSSFLRYISPEARSTVEQIYQRRMTGQSSPTTYETFVQHKDGHTIPVEISAGLVNYLGEPADFAFVHNISARKQIEENLTIQQGQLELLVRERTRELQKANEHLQQEVAERQHIAEILKIRETQVRQIIDLVPHMIFARDRDGRFILANKSVAQLHNVSPEEIVGKTYEELENVADDYQRYLEEDRYVLESAVPMIIYEDSLRTLDGQMHLHRVTKIPYTVSGSDEQAILGIAVDIDREKAAERQLKHARDAAEAASQAKSYFLANMSHELRTPLNHIIGFTELVVDKNFGELNDVQEEYLNDVLDSSRHLMALINDILDLSKIEAGKMELELSEVNLQSLLERGLLMIKEKAMRHQLQLSLDIRHVPESFLADERKLKQVLFNLLSNAVKFTPPGGRICVCAQQLDNLDILPYTKQQALISQKCEFATGAFLEISVTDTGIGLLEKDLERIFQAFEQVDRAENRKYDGTGLGLSLSRQFIALHCGQIWAESAGEGGGSTFRIVVPLHAY